MLTNKCKKDFEKWALKNVKTHLVKKIKIRPNTMDWVFDDSFYELPLSMQIGVYEDFAESLGCYLYFTGIVYGFYSYELNFKGVTHYINGETKSEAREELIKQLNNLINNHIVDTNKKV